MRNAAVMGQGQSNFQGAARIVSGGVADKYRSKYTGLTDPFPGSNAALQGGSCFPYLIDLAYENGTKLDVFNYAIGGASVRHYTGNLGGSVVGNPATPAAVGFFSGGEYTSGNLAVPLKEGEAGFDPFGLLARSRAAMLAAVNSGRYDVVVGYWSNGEADTDLTAAMYAAYLTSITNYMLASGAQQYLIGLSSKPAAFTDASYQVLQQGIAQVIASQAALGKPVKKGHDMFEVYGAKAPFYPESNGALVHMPLRGQEVQAHRVHSALITNKVY